MQGTEKDLLRQIQHLLCFSKLVVSSNPRSEARTLKKPFFLKTQ